MKSFKNTLFSLFFGSAIVLLSIVSFLWYNNYPPLSKFSNPDIIKITSIKTKKNINKDIKIASYNIHFGIGHNDKTLLNGYQNFIDRLNEISQILKKIDADVVLLQEVDFNSKRSHNIDQALYLAKKSEYKYVVKHTTLKQKIHPFFHNIFGNIDHGMCILSKYPITSSSALVFEHYPKIPFFLKWLYSPHGALECAISFLEKNIKVINLHLEPWSKSQRLMQIEEIKNYFFNDKKIPLIVGGDFNTLPLELLKRNTYPFQEAPFFVNKEELNIKNEKTIEVIKKLSFSEAVPIKLYLNDSKKAFTYPAINPKVKLDYIFAGYRAKVKYGYIYKDAFIASDHLPIVAEIKIN
ncbi:MAG: hypothetical protein K1060chlam5_00292 [Candidatus Anoxychlamydiales bacterium]|nr:hypothetical protein [Candidatus Anoxychlamydiales bacterium]